MAKKGATEIHVAVAEVVDFLRLKGDFAPALRQVVERKVAADAARKDGVAVTRAELQNTANAFRVMHGLHKASDTKKWLSASGLSVKALEEYLETSILISKWKDRLQSKVSVEECQRSPEIQAAIRELKYAEWLRKAMK